MSIFPTQSSNSPTFPELQQTSASSGSALAQRLTSVFTTNVVLLNSSESETPSTRKRNFTSISKNSVNKMSSDLDEDFLFNSRIENVETDIKKLLKIKNEGNLEDAKNCFFSLFGRIKKSRELLCKNTIHDKKWDRILADVKTFYNPDEEEQPFFKKRKTSSSSTSSSSSSTYLSSTSSNSEPTSAPKKISRTKDEDKDFKLEDSSSTDEELSTSDMDDDFSDDDDSTYSLKQEKRISENLTVLVRNINKEMQQLNQIMRSNNLNAAKLCFSQIFARIREKRASLCDTTSFDESWDEILTNAKCFHNPDKGEPSPKKRKISTRSSTRSNFTSSSIASSSNSSSEDSDSVEKSKAIPFASISSSGSDVATDPVTSESGSDSSDDDSDEDYPAPNFRKDDLRTNRITRSSSNSISTSAQASSPSCSGNLTILDDSRSSESPSTPLLSSSTTQSQTPKLSIDKQKEIKNKLLEAIGKYQRLLAWCKKQDRVERSFLEDVKQCLDEAIKLIQEKSGHLTDSSLSSEKTIIEENLRKLQEISKIFKQIL